MGLSVLIWRGILSFSADRISNFEWIGKIKVPQKMHIITAFIILAFGITHVVLGLGLSSRSKYIKQKTVVYPDKTVRISQYETRTD